MLNIKAMESTPVVAKKNHKDKSKCEKCQKEPSKICNRDKYLCYNCFEEIISHKFRSNLRTNCKIRHEDYVLVCISGGNASMAMLNMFYKTFYETTTNRKLFFKLKILYIDDSIFNPEKEQIVKERETKRNFLTSLCSKYHFDIDIINLENIFLINDKNSNLTNSQTNIDNVDKYLSIFNKIPTKGGFRSQFVRITTQNLIFAHCLRNSFTKIVYGSSGQGVVKDLFSQITIGKGCNIRHSTSYLDEFYLGGKIQILKPLRDFFNKEILYYNYYNKIDVLYSHFDMDKSDSILNQFFETLQSTKLSTVPSVINTAEKLILDKNDSKYCKFCLGKYDTPVTSLEFGSEGSKNSTSKNENLCYGCLRMFSNIQDKNEEDTLLTLFSSLSI